MFTASRTLFKIVRGNLTAKRGNKNFYKGRGAPSMGFHSKKGQYLITTEKFAKNTFVVPDLTGFPLKPYVSKLTPKQNPNPDFEPHL